MPDVQQLIGRVIIEGADTGIASLLKVGAAFDAAAQASTAALRQINNFGSAQGTQTAAGGVNQLTAANQKLNQSVTGLTAAEKQRITTANQIAQLQQRVAAADTDAAGRVRLYTQAVAQATQGSKEYYQAQLKLIQSQNELARIQTGGSQGTLQRAISGAGGQVLGALGLAGGIAAAGQQLLQYAAEGQQINVSLESNRRTLGALFSDVDRGNAVYAQAIAWGQKYNFTQQQMGEAAQAAALLIRDGTSSVADTFDVLARLQAKAPDKSFNDAVRAVTELQAGQFQSLERIFNIPAAAVQNLSKEITAGADPIKSLNTLLNDMGITDDVLKTRTEGATGAQNAYNVALEGTKIRLGEIRLASGVTAGQTTLLQGFSGGLDVLMGKLSLDQLVQGLKDAQQQGGASGDVFSSLIMYFRGLANAETTAAAATDKSTAATTGHATAAQNDAANTARLTAEYDQLGKSLTTLTDRALRPYKTAVDQASDALKTHQASEKAAKDSVDAISASLTAAKAKFQDFASAQLAGTKAYADQRFALDQQQSSIKRDMLSFEAPGAGLDKLLSPIQSQIDAADRGLKGYASDLDEINSFVEDQTRTVKDAEEAQKSYDRAVGDAKTNLDQQQSRLDALTGVYDTLTSAINEAKRAQDDLRRTPLIGEGALSDKLFAMDENIKRQQLRLDQARLGGADKNTIKGIQDTIDKLRTQEDAARLRGELEFDAQHRKLEQQGVPRDEKTYADASHDIGQYQKGIADLTTAQTEASAAIEDQKKVIADAKWDLLDATGAQRLHTESVDAEKAALDRLKESQATIQKQYSDQKSLLADLKTQLDDTRTKALKPFQDQIDELGRRAQVLDLSEKLELDPLKKKIEETAKPIKEMTFAEIITGLTSTNTQIGILQGKLDNAKDLLKTEQDATKVAQGNYDAATAALKAQQTYFDNLKIGLDDLKTKLTESKDIWGDLSTLINAINAANGVGGLIGPKVPAGIGGTGGGPYDIGAINSIIGKNGGGMTGEGALLVQLSQKYGIPLPLALAMLQHESQFDTTGASVANNNPGNLKLTSTTEGYGGMPGTAASDGGRFARFSSVAQGVEAYFHLLQDAYGNFIKNNDLAGLIGKYAPSSSNDTAGYIKTVQDLITQYLEQIIKQAAASTGQGPLAAGEAALGLSGSQVTQGFIRPDGSVHGGIDLAGAAAGTPIHALQGGKVVASKWDDAWGNLIMVADATTGKLEEYYGHLQDRLVKVGDIIKQGDIIGTLGGTGSESTGVHLHLQMYDENGQLIDPMAALAKMFGTGKGPTEADLQVLTAYLTAMGQVNTAIKDTGPNLPVLAGQIAGVGDAADAAATGLAGFDGQRFIDDMIAQFNSKGGKGGGLQGIVDNLFGGGKSSLVDSVSTAIASGSGMSIAGPNMDTLAGSIAGVGAAAASAAPALDDAAAAMNDASRSVQDIVDSINLSKGGFQDAVNSILGGGSGTSLVDKIGAQLVGRGGLSGSIADVMNRATGSGMSIGGPHWGDLISGGRSSRTPGDPQWGEGITTTAAAATDANKAVQDVVTPWETSWQNLGTAVTTNMNGVFTTIDTTVEKDLDRIADLVTAINDAYNRVMALNGLNVKGPGGLGGGGGGGGGGTPGGNITFNVLDRYAVGRKLRKMGS